MITLKDYQTRVLDTLRGFLREFRERGGRRNRSCRRCGARVAA